MKKLVKNIVLSLTLGTSVTYAAEDCSEKVLKSFKKEGNQIVGCVTYQQKIDKKSYLTLLDTFTDSEGTQQARVRHFIQNEKSKKFELAFNVDDLGEYFLKLGPKVKEESVSVVDINKDGWLEVVFRVYTNPSSMVIMHSFNSKSEKITSLGILEKDFGEAEFFPYIPAHYDAVVSLEEGSVKLKELDGKVTTYVWKNNYFSKVSK